MCKYWDRPHFIKKSSNRCTLCDNWVHFLWGGGLGGLGGGGGGPETSRDIPVPCWRSIWLLKRRPVGQVFCPPYATHRPSWPAPNYNWATACNVSCFLPFAQGIPWFVSPSPTPQYATVWDGWERGKCKLSIIPHGGFKISKFILSALEAASDTQQSDVFSII